ncbi:MAG TPA: ABC transporter ATP-binding protein [Firmicutes bacterium]|uniref:ABC transporter ATP-binding protein n=1 Tax=Candidatus Fermentithermobacillus carboniphilus TaxID=3085328 RepID=A0AAT9LFY2_9FIRM|nr:MAG: ABC transporter ATP-binding protein [Candidatus Fermentithermobacillus carboniphilus]HHW18576.1 ABC transporter ATP-binding protein [Candidatus Fermentithermobacillaceae bacterium]
MNNRAVEMKDVRKAFGEFCLRIDDLSLDRGYVLGLVGQNGAGKSTTIKMLLNLVYPDRGTISVLGLRQPKDEIEIRRRVGYLSETPAFYEEMTAGWIAGLVKRYYPNWDDRLYAHYLDKFNLDPNRKVKEFSRGMKVKFGLTLALSHRPELLILDEPTSGIDPVIRRELLEEIAGIIKDEDRTVIFSSHITQDVEQVADYVAILDQGTVVEYSDREDLFDRWKKVTGTATSPHSIRDSFVAFKCDTYGFTGITNRFSPDWLEELNSRGATDLKVSNLRLDEILISLARREF